MTALAAGSGVNSISGYGTDWLYFFAPYIGAFVIAVLAVRAGTAPAGLRGVQRLLVRLGDGLGRAIRLPAYAAIGVGTMAMTLLVAVLGFLWDVAWHIDRGRDELIFTPGHTAILAGLSGIVVAGALVIAVASLTDADVALRWKGWRAPRSAIAMVLVGLGGMSGFPLDEFGHRAYGIDVTMWGPTHLLMIGAGSFGPLVTLLLVAEAGGLQRPRALRPVLAALCTATLTGFTTFQLEFDLGVPQWQALYHPVLVAMAAALGLTIARRVLGPGGAIEVAIGFVVMRSLMALLVGEALELTSPRFPLYVGCAIAVELAAALTRTRSVATQAIAHGVAVATLGIGSEWAWTHLVARSPWQPRMLPWMWVPLLMAVCAAVLGLALARSITGRSSGLPKPVLALSGLGVALCLAIPFPRVGADATATVETASAGAGLVDVTVTFDRPVVAEDADRFNVLAWQGDAKSVQVLMRQIDEDSWRSEGPVPAGGRWKTIVRLASGSVVAGLPVALPEDEEIGAPEIPLVASRTVPVARDTKLLMREARAGESLPAILAYTAIGIVLAVWLTSFTWVAARMRRRRGLEGSRVLVTGALGGLGVAVSEGLRREGASVVGIDLVAGDGVLAADVCDPASTQRAVEAAAAVLGGIDCVVNLAGIGRAQDAGDLPDADARRTVEINLFGTWTATAAALPWLVESRGHVVVTASGLAIATMPYSAAYSASKRAVTAYADVLRSEYSGRITVTTVNPGYIRTAIHEVSAAAGASLEGVVPADTVEEAAEAYVRACTERPRSLATSTRTAVNLLLARLFPPSAERVLRRKAERLGRPTPAFVLTDEELAARRRPEVPTRTR